MATSSDTPKPQVLTPPDGFENTDAPWLNTGADTQCLLETNRRGYLLIKTLVDSTDSSFWHIERWVRGEDKQFDRETSTATDSEQDLNQLLTEEATAIREQGHTLPKYQK